MPGADDGGHDKGGMGVSTPIIYFLIIRFSWETGMNGCEPCRFMCVSTEQKISAGGTGRIENFFRKTGSRLNFFSGNLRKPGLMSWFR